MAILRDDQGNVIAFICSRPSRPRRCSYCDNRSTKLCDFALSTGKTCDAPLCNTHTYSPAFEKDYCRSHRRKMEEPARAEQRKLEMQAKQRDTLIFFARSKYAGRCRDKDCCARWKEGEPMYWDRETREVFCNKCGEIMNFLRT